MEAFAHLKRIVDRIDDLTKHYGHIDQANGLPASMAREIERLSIRDGYSNPSTPAHEALLVRIKSEMQKTERLRLEGERDILLHKLSMELEGLRAILPNVAARASIEIGITARNLISQE